MATRIEAVESIAPLPRVVNDRRRQEEETPREAPKDEVELSHPGDRRTLQLLKQILADSLGHNRISDAARGGEHPSEPAQIAAFLLIQVNTVLVAPFFAVTPNATPDDFDDFMTSIEGRLEQGKDEARSVFRSLETASPKHLGYVDSVGQLLNEALDRLVDKARLDLTAK